MRAAIILPARLASTRLPNKLLLDRSGKTVLEHTLERALEAQRLAPELITRILVAADDGALVQAARRAGVEAVLTRVDHTSGTDRIAEAAERIGEEIVINLQADEPEIEPASVVLAGRLIAADSGAQMATLAVPLYDEEKWQRPNIVKVIPSGDGRALYFSRAAIPFVRDNAERGVWTRGGRCIYGYHHLGLYAYRREFLLGYKALPDSILEKLEKLEQLRAVEAGVSIRLGIVETNPPGIDTPEDYEAFLLRRKSA